MFRSFFLLLIVSLVACSDGVETSSNDEAMVLHAEVQLANGLFTTKQNNVYRTQDAYELALFDYSSDTPFDVDFGNHQVLLIDMGEQPSLGHSIQVASVDENQNNIVVDVVLPFRVPDVLWIRR